MKRVLVADDDGSWFDIVQAALRECEVVRARSSNEAISLLDEQHFDVVITDWRMPGSGRPVVEECERLGVPVYLVSASPETTGSRWAKGRAMSKTLETLAEIDRGLS